MKEHRIVKDIKIEKGSSVDKVMRNLFESGGFSAKKLALGVNILEKMIEDKKCFNFLSFPACIMATGTRGVIVEMIRRKLFDAVITTCGTLDHDLARLWKPYYHGSFIMDDKKLHKQGVSRLGNVLVPNESYGIILERKLQPIFESIYNEGKRRLSTYELVWEVGKRLDVSNKEESMVYWVYKNKIPVFVPGITDGAFGYQLWMFANDKKDFIVDILKDETKLSDIAFTEKKTGALMIGGGISKHHTIWWNQFKDGLDYAVFITTAVEWDGSLSGARLREAVSWGKINENARYVTIEGDATILLPFMFASLLERI